MNRCKNANILKLGIGICKKVKRIRVEDHGKNQEYTSG